MAKRKQVKGNTPESESDSAVQAMLHGAPDAMVAPVPVPRLRGDGMTCPKCDSAMISKGPVPANHPFQRLRWWKCKHPKCGYRMKR